MVSDNRWWLNIGPVINGIKLCHMAFGKVNTLQFIDNRDKCDGLHRVRHQKKHHE